jgi:hypothetical protein
MTDLRTCQSETGWGSTVGIRLDLANGASDTDIVLVSPIHAGKGQGVTCSVILDLDPLVLNIQGVGASPSMYGLLVRNPHIETLDFTRDTDSPDRVNLEDMSIIPRVETWMLE